MATLYAKADFLSGDLYHLGTSKCIYMSPLPAGRARKFTMGLREHCGPTC